VVRIGETAQKTTTEKAYSLLSAALTQERFNVVARQHQGVENSLDWRLDWRLDAVINEDQDRTRMEHGPSESRRTAPHGNQRHRERELQRVVARKVQTHQFERELPLS
jgi:predicted transposase YbfD/YdcC